MQRGPHPPELPPPKEAASVPTEESPTPGVKRAREEEAVPQVLAECPQELTLYRYNVHWRCEDSDEEPEDFVAVLDLDSVDASVIKWQKEKLSYQLHQKDF